MEQMVSVNRGRSFFFLWSHAVQTSRDMKIRKPVLEVTERFTSPGGKCDHSHCAKEETEAQRS